MSEQLSLWNNLPKTWISLCLLLNSPSHSPTKLSPWNTMSCLLYDPRPCYSMMWKLQWISHGSSTHHTVSSKPLCFCMYYSLSPDGLSRVFLQLANFHPSINRKMVMQTIKFLFTLACSMKCNLVLKTFPEHIPPSIPRTYQLPWLYNWPPSFMPLS